MNKTANTSPRYLNHTYASLASRIVIDIKSLDGVTPVQDKCACDEWNFHTRCKLFFSYHYLIASRFTTM